MLRTTNVDDVEVIGETVEEGELLSVSLSL